MKYLSILFAAIFSSAAFSEPILVYHYGNQVIGSTLTITDDGQVIHQEREVWRTKDIPRKSLDPQQLVTLKNLIEQSFEGSFIRGDCEASLGRVYGSLVVYNSQGEALTLREDKLLESLQCERTEMASEAASEIERFIYTFVKTHASSCLGSLKP